MKIKSIKLIGWRSFDGQGIELNNLKRINLIIGPNNSGKSNIFKYIYKIKNQINSTKKFNFDSLNSLETTFTNSDTWANLGEDIKCTFEVDVTDDDQWLPNKTIPLYHTKYGDVKLKTNHSLKGITSYSVLHLNQKPLVELVKQGTPRVLNIDFDAYKGYRDDTDYLHDSINYWSKFAEQMVFIDPIRHHSRASSEVIESDFDGSNIKVELLNLHNSVERAMEYRKYEKLMEEFLKKILIEENLSINITIDNIRFYITRGEEEVSAYLDQLGTGVSQLFMILSYLFLHRDKKLNIFMEEPESNLHPNALNYFIKLIEDNFLNHSFYITTHSSSLIDQVNDDWSVHRVYRKNNQPSMVVPCNNLIQQHMLLDDLGIRASQLVQSNLIIWVEGPSDRIYIKKWINDFDESLIEGKHFNFLMYGGSNLSNYSVVAENDEFFNMLSVNRYAVIICDSDKDNSQDELKERVVNIQGQVKKLNEERKLLDGESFDNLKIWITHGREIENYIPSDLLFDVSGAEGLVQNYINVAAVGGSFQRKKILFNAVSIDFGKYDYFNEILSESYKFEDDTYLESHQKMKIANNLSNKKTLLAREVINKWNVEHYSDNLKKEIKNLIKIINHANGKY